MPALMLGAFAERVRLAVSFRPDTHGSVHSMSLCAGTLPAQQRFWAIYKHSFTQPTSQIDEGVS